MSAAKYYSEAEKLATKKGFLGGVFGGGPKFDEAGEYYKKAAAAYKLEKDFTRASDAYVKCSEMHKHENEAYQEANMLKEAGDCMRRISGRKAMPLYEKAAHIFSESGKFSQSGRLFETLAQSFEAEGDIENAKPCYKKAGELFEMDEFGKSKYVANITKYADLASMESKLNYDEAIKIYEECGKRAVQNDLTQYNAKKWFGKATVIYMVKGDAVTADVNFERYTGMDMRLGTSREGKLLLECIHAMEASDAVAFTNALGDYDSVSKLDAWHVHFFSQIKRRLDKESGVSSKPSVGATTAAADDSDDDLC